MAKMSPVDLGFVHRAASAGEGMPRPPAGAGAARQRSGSDRSRRGNRARAPSRRAGWRSASGTSTGITDERHEGVRHRPAGMVQDAGQSGLDQHPRHSGVMHPQLLGDRTDRPFLDMVIAQDLSLQIRGYGHLWRPVRSDFDIRLDPTATQELVANPTRATARAPMTISWPSDVRRRPAHRRRFARSPPSPNPTTAHHSADVVVNRDASLYFAERDSQPFARHVCGGRGSVLLITLIGLALLGPARLAGTTPSTINLATVAPAADKGLTMALAQMKKRGGIAVSDPSSATRRRRASPGMGECRRIRVQHGVGRGVG